MWRDLDRITEIPHSKAVVVSQFVCRVHTLYAVCIQYVLTICRNVSAETYLTTWHINPNSQYLNRSYVNKHRFYDVWMIKKQNDWQRGTAKTSHSPLTASGGNRIVMKHNYSDLNPSQQNTLYEPPRGRIHKLSDFTAFIHLKSIIKMHNEVKWAT